MPVNRRPRKYVLQFTLPKSGSKFLASKIQNKFALIPIPENSMKGTFLMWDTPGEVGKFMKELRALNPEWYKKLWALKPEVVPVIVTEVGMFLDLPRARKMSSDHESPEA